MILIFIMAAALAAALAFGAIAVFAISFSLVAVRASMPKGLQAPLIGLFALTAVAFYFAAYAYLFAGATIDNGGDRLIALILPFVAACAAVSFAALLLRLTLKAIGSLGQSRRFAGAFTAIIGGHLIAYGVLVAFFDPLSTPAKPVPPIALSFEGEPTHCVYSSAFDIYEGRSDAFPRLARLKQWTKLRMTPTLQTRDAGWRKFSLTTNGQEVTGFAMANGLAEINSDGTCFGRERH